MSTSKLVKRKTIIADREVWFHICALNECNVTYIGPFFCVEDAQDDLEIAECDNAHFLTQYVPDFAEVSCNYYTREKAERFLDRETYKDLLKWYTKHNENAHQHPIFKQARAKANAHEITTSLV